MRAFLTGATGFIGGHVARKLRQRGDEVVALVRDPTKAGDLRRLDCELVEGDLSSAEAIRRGCEGVDSVFHIGAVYKVGIPKSERPAMHEANVGGTERVLDAAVDAGVKRIVYVSTVGAFGNTRGEVVDEAFHRVDLDWLSCYDETKYRAHQVAEERIARGAPIVIVQPGGVYGPNDHSEVGNMIEQTSRGKLPAKMFPDMGMMLAHVEDIAEGILLAHDKGDGRRGLRPVGRADHDRRADRQGRRAIRAQAAALHDAEHHAQGLGAARPGDRAADGLPTQPRRAGQGVERRHPLGEGRQGTPRARLRPA